MANEKRLIDANEVIRSMQMVIDEENNPNSLGCCVMREFIKGLELTPTVDAVEVVRCKDCEYRHDSCFAGKGNIYCDYHHKYFGLDDFCSYGERRSDG
jgi:hypothetical protein